MEEIRDIYYLGNVEECINSNPDDKLFIGFRNVVPDPSIRFNRANNEKFQRQQAIIDKLAIYGINKYDVMRAFDQGCYSEDDVKYYLNIE